MLLLAPMPKPALLRRFFDLACADSRPRLSDQEMMGQFDETAKTNTLAHDLDVLLEGGMAFELRVCATGSKRPKLGLELLLQDF